MNDFIMQTAKDYDLTYEEVEAIYNKYQPNFYEELETRRRIHIWDSMPFCRMKGSGGKS